MPVNQKARSLSSLPWWGACLNAHAYKCLWIQEKACVPYTCPCIFRAPSFFKKLLFPGQWCGHPSGWCAMVSSVHQYRPGAQLLEKPKHNISSRDGGSQDTLIQGWALGHNDSIFLNQKSQYRGEIPVQGRSQVCFRRCELSSRK